MNLRYLSGDNQRNWVSIYGSSMWERNAILRVHWVEKYQFAKRNVHWHSERRLVWYFSACAFVIIAVCLAVSSLASLYFTIQITCLKQSRPQLRVGEGQIFRRLPIHIQNSSHVEVMHPRASSGIFFSARARLAQFMNREKALFCEYVVD